MFEVQNPKLFFVAGLALFFVAHICYISAFVIDFKFKTNGFGLQLYSFAILLSAFEIASYWYLYSHLGDMQIPMLLYIIVIVFMGIAAFARRSYCNQISFSCIVWGTLFLIVSDAASAYHKFVSLQNYLQLISTATYMLAQFLIAIGTVERKYKKDNTKKIALIG